jgi:hypothetical protein
MACGQPPASGDDIGQAFNAGVAEQGIDLIGGAAQQAFIVRQFLAIRSPQQNGAQFRRGFLDSDRANSNSEIRQLSSRRYGVKVIFDRTEIRGVLAIAKERFEFFLLHAARTTC